jgi:Na+-driven multidrug efflux pump
MAATPEVLKLAPNIMRTYFLTFLCMGVTVLSIYYLQSMMRAKLSMTIALLRGFVVSGLLLYMLPLIMGMSGVWWAMPISEGVVAVIALSHIKHMRVTCV